MMLASGFESHRGGWTNDREGIMAEFIYGFAGGMTAVASLVLWLWLWDYRDRRRMHRDDPARRAKVDAMSTIPPR